MTTVLPFSDAAERVKQSLDIVDVVSRHVVLKKKGRNYSGLCPFHKDSNPSFDVNREKNVFICRSCGEGGDVVTFLMKIDNKTYGQVIRDTAAEMGIEVLEKGQNPDEVARKRDLNQKILEINAEASGWFIEQLDGPQGQIARDYLQRRDIAPDTIRRFGLGYALDGWENLSNHLLSKLDFTRSNPDLLVTAGISNARREGSGYYDRFRNRLVIPIHDDSGRVVGFGGRAFSDEDKPKYLNSPETALYQKSRILYGLYQAKDSIKESGFAVVMEGYFDVISAHVGGVPQAVGSCGTALTDQHLKLLTRFGAETIYLAFDSDEAGLKAALSAIALIEPHVRTTGIRLKIAIVPDGKDPDDFIRQHGGEAFRQLLDGALPHLDFKFEQALSGIKFYTSEGRIEAVNRITPLLISIAQPVMRTEYRKKYAERIGVTEEDLSREVKRFLRQKRKYESRRYEQYANPIQKDTKKSSGNRAILEFPPTLNRRQRNTPLENVSNLREKLLRNPEAAETIILKLLLLNQESFGAMEPIVKNIQFTDNVHQLLVDAIRQAATASETIEGVIRSVSDRFADQPEIQRTFAEIRMGQETFSDEIGLTDLSPTEFRSKVTKIASYTLGIWTEHQWQKRLKTLADKAEVLEKLNRDPLATKETGEEESELLLIELQYQFREQLAKNNTDLL